MTTTPPDAGPRPPADHTPGPDTGPRVSWDDVRDLARLRRSVEDRRIAGVAGGIARHLDIDPLIVRVALVVLALFGGAGLFIYAACWLVVPEEGTERARVPLDRRNRAIALVGVGVVALLFALGSSGWGDGAPWVLLVAALIALVVTSGSSRRTPREDVTEPGASAPLSSYAEGPVGPSKPYARPANPRKRGPVLFWFTMALCLVALGALSVVDLAGVDVTPSAYPALVLAICGLGLVLGAFWGRAGGLVLVGLMALFATGISSAAANWDAQDVVERPATSAVVHGSYEIDAGELVLDLTRVSDTDGLDGRTIHVTGNLGHLDIRVPEDVTVVATGAVNGPGGVHLFTQDAGGFDTSLTAQHDGGPGAPVLTIDAQLDLGSIDVTAR